MFKVNENYLKLPGSYLFSTIGKKVAAYQAANPDKQIIRLGIGDVTQPLSTGNHRCHCTRLLMRWAMPRHFTDMHQILDMNS